MNSIDRRRMESQLAAAARQVMESDTHGSSGAPALEVMSLASALRYQAIAMTYAESEPETFEKIRADAQSMTYLMASKLSDLKVKS